MNDRTNPVVVVGMAGRFPGAPDAEGLWDLMMRRAEAVRPVPADRWDTARQLDPGRNVQAVGGFLDGVDLFDAGFFGISPREAADMDPQQRLLLEVAWRAVEDAGQRTDGLKGSRTGVYVGASWHDYQLLRKDRGARPTQHSLVGTALDVLAARISYALRLRGPSLTVETGCSSSLVALHLAAQALRQGDIDAAIVGGVNLILAPDVSVGLTHFGGLSPDGRCAAFAASANGFVRGEGVAAVCLKTLDRALRDGDRIHGTVLRTAVNNDGGDDSMVMPSSEAQEELLNGVYGDGPDAVPADSVAYVEAHGTGTRRGDPAEAAAIGRAIGRRRTLGPLPIGSVKTNIGHLEAAAGMAGLFKALLALRHRVVPPSLHAEVLNPDIPFDDLNVRVLREPLALPSTGPVRLGVSSFGWGGTNAHVVVATPPERTGDASAAGPARITSPRSTRASEPVPEPAAASARDSGSGSGWGSGPASEQAADPAPASAPDSDSGSGPVSGPASKAAAASAPAAGTGTGTGTGTDRAPAAGTGTGTGTDRAPAAGSGTGSGVDTGVAAVRGDGRPARPATGLPVFVPLSAQEPGVLAERAAQLGEQVPQSAAAVAELAGTLARRRDHFPVRAALLAPTPARLADALTVVSRRPEEGDRSTVVTGRAVARGRTAFVFPGQGSQWSGMGEELYRESPYFADVVGRCADALRPHVTWDLLDVFTGRSGDTWMARVDTLQPVSWAMSLGLCALWRAAGVEPDVVIGHSQGEIAAAVAAGILSYEDAALVVARRSAIVRRTCGHGRMLAVDLEPGEARAALRRFGGSVSLAAHNGPTSCVLSGDGDAVLALMELLEAEGTYCKLVNVDYASHSDQMGELRDDLLAALADAVPRQGTVELLSTVRAEPVAGTSMDAAYWAENLRRPVLFADALTRALDDGVTHVVEVGPHPVLTPAIEQLTAGRARPAATLTTLRRGEGGPQAFVRALARGYVAGLEPFGDLPRCRPVPLPPHPMRPERHWFADDAAPRHTGAARGLDVRLDPSPGERDVWHAAMELEVADLPWLADHRVHGAVVLPGAATLALALDTGRARAGSAPRVLHDVTLSAAVAFGDQGPRRLAVEWRDDVSEGGSFRLLSLAPDGAGWTEHAAARAAYHDGAAAGTTAGAGFPDWVDSARDTGTEAFYGACAGRGLGYGPVFRTLRALYRGPDGRASAGEAVLDGSLRDAARRFVLHPALWDGALQVALPLFEQEAAQAALVPTAIRRIEVPARGGEPVTAVWSHAVRRDDDTVDLHVFDGDRRPVLAMEGLRLEVLGGTVPPAAADGPRLHRVRWADVTGVGEGTGTGTGTDPGLRPGDASPSGAWIVCGDTGGLAKPLVAALTAGGAEVTEMAEMTATAETAEPDGQGAFGGATAVAGVVFVAPTAEAGLAAQQRGLGALTDVVRACAGLPTAPRLTVVTGMAQAATAEDRCDPGGALYWGYTRVLRREHGELGARVVDVDPADGGWAAACAREILGTGGFGGPDVGEDQIALRGHRRLAVRLTRGDSSDDAGAGRPPLRTVRRPFRVTSVRPGLWEGVRFRPAACRPPGPGEVVVEVTAAALNFIDVMKALGTYPDPRSGAGLLGGECAGRVVAVGPDVTGYTPGQPVVACAFGSLASRVTVRADHVRPIPDGLGDVRAAALPLAMATVWYGLADLARLERDETVLVHSAAGGVGLAAVQVARLLGARVVATAGTGAKRRYLRGLGITDVFDSRDLGWASEVRAATEGRGVDVVLNSLTGAAVPAGLGVLAEDGRFVELGKKDIHGGHRLALDSFRKGVSFFAVDLAGLMERRPRRFARTLADVWRHVSDGTLAPLPVRTRPFAEAADALREMSHGEHIGKFVLTDPDSVAGVAPVPLPDGRFLADATYLVTGGLGALGLSLAEFLAERGAGALALMGRSAPGPDAERRLAALRAAGTLVEVVRCDVGDEAAVRRALRGIRERMPALRGVLHAAGVLADATIDTLTPAGLAEVLRPKALGAHHLDAATEDDPLDLFVLFSSAAALVGNTGQAAYAAANACLDALAEVRRARGLPALSVQWGPFADVGLAAADERRGARLDERGMGGFSTREAWPALVRMLERDEPVVGYVPLDLERWFDAYPDTADLPSWRLLRALTGDGAGAASGGGLRERVLASPGKAGTDLAEDAVRELAGRVLRLAPDRIAPQTPFKALGLDSLMSLELRNRLEAAFGLRLSPTLLWAHDTVRALSGALVEDLRTAAPAQN